MADTLTVTLQPRSVTGKKVKNLRKSGIVPVHLYGQNAPSQSLQCEERKLLRLLAAAGMNTPITVSVDGEDRQALTFIREIQWGPVRGELLHVDFMNVAADVEIVATVPITLVGDAPALRNIPASSVSQILRAVDVSALPLSVPSELIADVSTIVEAGDVVRVSDIAMPEGVECLADDEDVIARLEITQEEPEEEVDEEGLESEGGEGAAETEEA